MAPSDAKLRHRAGRSPGSSAAADHGVGRRDDTTVQTLSREWRAAPDPAGGGAIIVIL
uniref:Uncharacterized protein n=1 Tax=Oryza sativa subsp. japonica TaxID=39947 RepID=Q651V7_ORYSJ|nr:hypothetical protein [Oryza sativa Japonica Group]